MLNKAKFKEIHSFEHTFVLFVFFFFLRGLGEGCDRGKDHHGRNKLTMKMPLKNLEMNNYKNELKRYDGLGSNIIRPDLDNVLPSWRHPNTNRSHDPHENPKVESLLCLLFHNQRKGDFLLYPL